MRRLLFFSIMALIPIGCAGQPDLASVKISVLDDVGGSAQASWTISQDGAARIEVAARVRDCVLRDFEVTSGVSREATPGTTRIELPDAFQGDKAVLRLRPGESATVLARYVHTVVVDAGNRSEPEQETETTGSGLIQVGRALSNGYRFDHYEFSAQATGPGGASAHIKEASRQGSEQAYLKIQWYYDRYSKVSFSWKLFASGPCDAKP